MNEDQKLEQEIADGVNAKYLLDNKAFVNSLSRIYEDLESKALTTPATDTETCADIIRCKQLMTMLEKRIRSMVDTGKMAQIVLDDRSRNKPDKYL